MVWKHFAWVVASREYQNKYFIYFAFQHVKNIYFVKGPKYLFYFFEKWAKINIFTAKSPLIGIIIIKHLSSKALKIYFQLKKFLTKDFGPEQPPEKILQ